MKYKIFLVLFALLISIGASSFAQQYVQPSGTAPNNNTPEVLKTAPRNSTTGESQMYEKIGLWVGNINFNDRLSYLKNGSYAGSSTKEYGMMSNKLIVGGATIIPNNLTIGQYEVDKNDPTIKDITGNLKDQYLVTTKYPTPTLSNSKLETVARPLQAVVAGRILANELGFISQDVNNFPEITTSTGETRPSDKTFQLLANSDLNPKVSKSTVTNIGLGDSCYLTPADLGTSASDAGGCPAGHFMNFYRHPSTAVPNPNQTASINNNSNDKQVAICTAFNPSDSPKLIGRCNINMSRGKPIARKYFTGNCSLTLPMCTGIIGEQKEKSSDVWTAKTINSTSCSVLSNYDFRSNMADCGNQGQKIVNATLTSSNSSCTRSLLALPQSSNIAIPKTFSYNILWYKNGVEQAQHRDKLEITDCSVDTVTFRDEYEQFFEVSL